MNRSEIKMQSCDALRQSISKGRNTAECWAELRERNERVEAGMRVIASMKKRKESAALAAYKERGA